MYPVYRLVSGVFEAIDGKTVLSVGGKTLKSTFKMFHTPFLWLNFEKKMKRVLVCFLNIWWIKSTDIITCLSESKFLVLVKSCLP